MQKLQVLTLPDFISVSIFQFECTRWSFAIDLLWNVSFQTFDYFQKHVHTTLLISLCWHILH